MLGILWRLVGTALVLTACAEPGAGVSPSTAQRCTQSGGVWRPGVGACEHSPGGGGGY
jgi:hypothetical protein